MTDEAVAGKSIAIALSGGGTRAMAFHAGVLDYLAEAGLLTRVGHISSVSGGSLLTGLVFKLSAWKWPRADEYRSRILPTVKQTMITQDLGLFALRRLAHPANWSYLLSRANVAADAIERLWSIDARLSDLPARPVWSVNATTSETGRRFRFKQDAVGDYDLGYASAAEFKVADAMAVSAAYPGIIGPFVIETHEFEWRKRAAWDLPKEQAEIRPPPFSRIHLYDGGVYDNLGTEPLFDGGQQRPRDDGNLIVVSDAGAPLGQVGPARFRPFRLKRVADIMSSQARALRVRSFVNFLQRNPGSGAYLQIGAHAGDKLRAYGGQNPAAADLLIGETWTSIDDVARAAAYPTTLRRMDAADFDLLSRHGYETAKWNLALFPLP